MEGMDLFLSLGGLFVALFFGQSTFMHLIGRADRDRADEQIKRIETAIEAGTREHDQWRERLEETRKEIFERQARTDQRLDDLMRHLLEKSK